MDRHVRELQPKEEMRGLGGPRSDRAQQERGPLSPRVTTAFLFSCGHGLPALRYGVPGLGGGLSRLYSSRKRALLKGHCSGDFTKLAFTGFDSM